MFNSSNEDKQVELFNDLADSDRRPRERKFKLGKVALSLSYENIFTLIIGSIMLLIVCYSLGVEKGKQLAMLKSENIKTEVIKIEPKPSPAKQAEQKPAIKPAQPQTKKEKVKVAAFPSTKVSPYIQVATYSIDKYAKEELGRLKNKGYQPFLISRGKFREVCVGGYKDKNEAMAALKQLKKVYADCVLRHK